MLVECLGSYFVSMISYARLRHTLFQYHHVVYNSQFINRSQFSSTSSCRYYTQSLGSGRWLQIYHASVLITRSVIVYLTSLHGRAVLFVLFQYCTIDDVIALTNHLVVLRCENTLASGAARSSNASMNAAIYWGLGMLLSITLNRLMNLGPPVDQDWSSQQVQCTARKEWCSVLLTTNAVQFRQQYERSIAIFSRVSRPFTALHYG
jgi:hypothetical protein